MRIVWSEHATERASERGAFGPPPIHRIEKCGGLVEEGEEFHVTEFLYIWVCKRLDADTTMIVTVLINDDRGKLPRQRRDQAKRSRRMRAIKKREFFYDNYNL